MPSYSELLAQVHEMSAAPVYAKRYDVVSSTLAYLGEADAGSAEASAVWRIQELTFAVDGDVTTKWADGNTQFDNVWADRASLTFS